MSSPAFPWWLRPHIQAVTQAPGSLSLGLLYGASPLSVPAPAFLPELSQACLRAPVPQPLPNGPPPPSEHRVLSPSSSRPCRRLTHISKPHASAASGLASQGHLGPWRSAYTAVSQETSICSRGSHPADPAEQACLGCPLHVC